MSHSCQRAKEPAGAQGWLGWRIIALFGRHRRMVVGLGFLILIASLLDLAVPFLTRGLIDQILHS